MFPKKYLIFVIILFFYPLSSVLGQATLRGTVTDLFERGPLIGTTIVVEGTSIGTATDAEGKYQLRRIPSGEVIRVRFSYIGYESQTFELTLEEGEVRELDVEMSAESIEGQEINISAQAIGQIAAINQQKASDAIVNVVSEEKIRELPDANAAESIGRLSGVSISRSGGEATKVMLRGLSDKYINVTVDGVSLPTTDALARGIDLSTISQSSLAGIELFKSVTPDKDGDAIAGAINLVTRKAQKERVLRINATGGYNNIMNSFEQYDFNGNYGERFFNDVLGVQINGNIERKIRSNERNSIGYSTPAGSPDDYFISNLTLRFTDEIRTRNGLGLILDVNTPDNGSIKFSSMYSSTMRDYITHNRDFPRGVVTYSYRDTEQQIDLFTNSLTGQNHLLGLDINWGASYSQSTSENPFDYELIFAEAAGMGNTPFIRENPEQLIDFAKNNFQIASIHEGYIYTQETSHDEISLYADLIKDYQIGNWFTGTIKGGAKFSSQNRANENTRSFAPYRLGYW